jgi:hypothetical protein
VFHTADGLTVTAKVTKAGSDIWANLGATGEGAAADQAKSLSKMFDGWAYQIGNWKLAALVPTLDDLKPAPETKPAAPEASPAAPQGSP